MCLDALWFQIRRGSHQKQRKCWLMLIPVCFQSPQPSFLKCHHWIHIWPQSSKVNTVTCQSGLFDDLIPGPKVVFWVFFSVKTMRISPSLPFQSRQGKRNSDTCPSSLNSSFLSIHLSTCCQMSLHHSDWFNFQGSRVTKGFSLMATEKRFFLSSARQLKGDLPQASGTKVSEKATKGITRNVL